MGIDNFDRVFMSTASQTESLKSVSIRSIDQIFHKKVWSALWMQLKSRQLYRVTLCVGNERLKPKLLGNFEQNHAFKLTTSERTYKW